MARFDFGRIEILTFDCYGTLIDWEAGIAAGFRKAFGSRSDGPPDEALLEAYARHEARAEKPPYLRYRDVAGRSFAAACREFGVEPGIHEVRAFGESVGDWPAFPDSAAALARLAGRFRLGVITNCDDDLFAHSEARLGARFTWVVTAEQVGSYKPDPRNFWAAIERIGAPTDRILHVAQSLYHDHVPARRLGLATAWIDRRSGRPGFGATPPAEATPDLTAHDMATFAEVALA